MSEGAKRWLMGLYPLLVTIPRLFPTQVLVKCTHSGSHRIQSSATGATRMPTDRQPAAPAYCCQRIWAASNGTSASGW